ncbi:MAG: hypothetical protein V4620_11350 [Bacteroidota bacterium]
MRKNKILVCLTILIPFLTGCFIGAGTHGSLKGYQYSTTKDKLDSAVMFVIKNNPNINRNTNNVNYIVDQTDGKNDTIIDNYYNDGKSYLTIKIKTDKGQNEYTFRYYGGEEDWKTATTSEIFICYAYDELRKGGSEGNGGIDSKTLKHLTEIFEKELVSNIDKQLNLTHINTK